VTKHDVRWWHRHPFLTPWFCTCVEDLASAVPASEGPPHNPLPFDAGTGAAGSTPPPTVQLPVTTTAVTGTGGGSPRQPHLDCSEASRISAGITWN
jgi:hypothetical protein